MDYPDTTEDVDLTLRHVSRQFPEEFVRALLPPGAEISAAVWLDTQVTARKRQLDRALDVTADGHKRREHTEWQMEMAAGVPLRIFGYHTMLAMALATETLAGNLVPPIRSTLVLLSGREKPWPPEGEYRTSPTDAPPAPTPTPPLRSPRSRWSAPGSTTARFRPRRTWPRPPSR